MAETDSEPTDEQNGLTIKREKSLQQTETLVVQSKRGTGTNDRDKVRAEVTREAEIEIDDDTDLPDLIGVSEMQAKASEVAEVMEQVRETNNGE